MWMRGSTLGLLLIPVLTNAADASDGVLEINQSCATKTGCFAGDAASFPVTISAAGSYVLTSNLGADDDQVIEITSGSVTLNLAGFEVKLASGTSPPLIEVKPLSLEGVVVRNGHVSSSGDSGIKLGGQSIVEDIVARANLGIGIEVGDGSTVRRCNSHRNFSGGIVAGDNALIRDNVAAFNSGDGIAAGGNSTVHGNVAVSNGGDGIDVASGVVQGNTSSSNSNDGIKLTFGSAIGNNVRLNSSDGISVSAGTVMATNNTVASNTRCGFEATTSKLGFSNNVLRSNNGSSANLQVSDGTDLGSNLCGNHACITGPAASCP